MRLLLVRTDRLGDTVLTLGAVAELATAWPEADIDLVCAPGLAPLMSLAAGIDRVHPWQAGRPTQDLRTTLAAADYAGVAMLNSRPAMAWCLWRAGIPCRVGRGRRWYSILFSASDPISLSSAGIHEAEANRRLARLLTRRLGAEPAAEAPPPAPLAVPANELAAGRAHLASLGVDTSPVVLQPGSGGSSLDWPVARMRALAEQLRSRGEPVAIHLGPGDLGLTGAFDDFPCFGADLDLRRLAAVLAQCRCLVGNSTGPLHLAAALGRPVVGLYPPVRAMTPERWGPVGPGHHVLMPTPETIYPHRAAAPPGLMDRISVAEVLAAIAAVSQGATPADA